MPSSAEVAGVSRWRDGTRDWCAVAALLLLGSVACVDAPATAIDWQPALAWAQPWRAWTAAWVHYSPLHLLANVAGGLLVAAFGAAARVPRRAALAWLMAWPLTQVGLAWRPDLLHYGGLSGVLHAGVAVVATHLVVDARRLRRWIGVAVLAGIGAKLWLEAPLGPALREPAGWDIAVAPFAHLSGFVAGAASFLLLAVARRPSRARRHGILGDG